jgi:hypothetical protein
MNNYPGASSAYFHPTRKFPRPLRIGDWVRDLYPTPFPAANPNYPGANLYGRITATTATTATVRFDDHVECTVLITDLERL